MPDLIPLSPTALLFPGAVNSLVFVSGSRALLTDTGLDESHARKLLRAVEAAGLHPAAILNTHSHADHHGGNAFVLKRFPGLEVFAPPLEAAVIRHPVLEPLSLYGAMPPQALRSKFLLAPASPAQGVEAGTRTLGGVTVELLEVQGHAAQMYAVRQGDVLYAADALFGPESLGKHPLTFCADSGQQKASAMSLLALEDVRVTVPGHGDPADDLPALVRANRASLERVTGEVQAAVQGTGSGVDDVLHAVCARLNVEMRDAGALLLNRAVVSAHLRELLDLGAVRMDVRENRLLFSPA